MRTDLVALLVVALFTPGLHAQAYRGTVSFTVTQHDDGSCHGGTTSTTLNNASVVSFAVPSCAARVNISVNASVDRLGTIRLTHGPTGRPLEIIVGPESSITHADPVGLGDVDWNGLTLSLNSPHSATLYGGIDGDLLGPIYAAQIARLDIGGSINAKVAWSRLPSPTPAGTIIETGAIGSSGSLEQTGGRLDRLVLSGGSLNGPIYAPGGSIGEILIPSGHLNAWVRVYAGSIDLVRVGGDITTNARLYGLDDSSGTTPNLSARIGQIIAGGSIGSQNSSSSVLIRSEGDMDLIQARDIHAQLYGNASYGNGIIHRVETTQGDIKGEMGASQIGTGGGSDGVFIAGNAVDMTIRMGSVTSTHEPLIGDLTIGGDFAAGSVLRHTDQVSGVGLAPGATILIGGSMDGRLSFGHHPPLGVQGQVVINAENHDGAWRGDVSINVANPDTGSAEKITLGPAQTESENRAPYYDRPAEQIGGGSIGEVPFGVHLSESAPAHNGVVVGDNEFIVRFYGPVSEFDTTTPIARRERPFRVERALRIYPRRCNPCGGANPCGSPWEDVTAAYDYELNSDGDPRRLRVFRDQPIEHEGGRWSMWVYRVRPADPSFDHGKGPGGTPTNWLVCDHKPESANKPLVDIAGRDDGRWWDCGGDGNYRVTVLLSQVDQPDPDGPLRPSKPARPGRPINPGHHTLSDAGVLLLPVDDVDRDDDFEGVFSSVETDTE